MDCGEASAFVGAHLDRYLRARIKDEQLAVARERCFREAYAHLEDCDSEFCNEIAERLHELGRLSDIISAARLELVAFLSRFR
ncbi:MAG: hypothetical protein WAP23_03800 [Candidatus Spechtbacterales bacterium]